MSKVTADLVWVDQGLGHGHTAINVYEDGNVKSFPFNGRAELIVIKEAIEKYLEEEKKEEEPTYDHCPHCKGRFSFNKPKDNICCWCDEPLIEEKEDE